MTRTAKHKKSAAARARKGKADKKAKILAATSSPANHSDDPALPDEDTLSFDDNREDCCWDGGVNYRYPSDEDDDDDDKDFEPSNSEWEDDSDDDDELEELVGKELAESLHRELLHELTQLDTLTGFEAIMKAAAEAKPKDWERMTKKRAFGYTGNSARAKRKREKDARDKEEEDKKKRAR